MGKREGREREKHTHTHTHTLTHIPPDASVYIITQLSVVGERLCAIYIHTYIHTYIHIFQL